MKNKYQEAFGDIVDNGVSLDYFNDKSVLPQDENPLFIVQELVEKETPMKLLKSQFDGYRECGNCNSIVVSTNHVLPKYCSQCGQRIDWGNENE